MILSRQTLIEILNRRCDRDLEHSGEGGWGWGGGGGGGSVYNNKESDGEIRGGSRGDSTLHWFSESPPLVFGFTRSEQLYRTQTGHRQPGTNTLCSPYNQA